MSSMPRISVPLTSGAVRAPCDIVTYSWKGAMVYCDVANTYEGAIDKALVVYEGLRNVSREHITFAIRAKVNHGTSQQSITVHIAPTTEAWTRVTRGLIKYEVVEVHVLNETGHMEVSPPMYAATCPGSEPGSKEKDVKLDVPQTSSGRPSSPRPQLFVKLRDAFRGD